MGVWGLRVLALVVLVLTINCPPSAGGLRQQQEDISESTPADLTSPLSSHSDVPSVLVSRGPPPESCEAARLKCAYRTGCGMALQNYLVGCSLVIQEDERASPDDPLAGLASARRCPEPCQHALIALTSTDEGKQLMNCRCTDEFCNQTKRRVEVCRPEVIHANRKETVVSCRVAQWICAADPLCSTALEYYHSNCRAMFRGKKCSHRCNNSLAILLRQEKAAKLASCKCDGREDYDCVRIRDNMVRLCLHKEPPNKSTPPPPSLETNEVVTRSLAVKQAPLLLGHVLLVLAAQLMLRSLLAQDT